MRSCTGRGRLHGIGTRQLIDRHHARGRLVVARRQVVDLVAQLDPRHIAQMQDRSIGIGAKNDIAELLRRDKPALRAHRVSKLLALGHRFAADLARGVHIVLRLHGVDHVGRGHAQLAPACRAAPRRAARTGRRRSARAHTPFTRVS